MDLYFHFILIHVYARTICNSWQSRPAAGTMVWNDVQVGGIADLREVFPSKSNQFFGPWPRGHQPHDFAASCALWSLGLLVIHFKWLVGIGWWWLIYVCKEIKHDDSIVNQAWWFHCKVSKWYFNSSTSHKLPNRVWLCQAYQTNCWLLLKFGMINQQLVSYY